MSRKAEETAAIWKALCRGMRGPPHGLGIGQAGQRFVALRE
jgi:hypothetical protein